MTISPSVLGQPGKEEMDDPAQRRAGVLARRAPLLALLLAGICSTSMVIARAGEAEADKAPAEWTETDAGIPVTDPLTIAKCRTCHAPDDKGNLSRISWIRSTPEGWSQTIKRMVKLNGLSLTPAEARSIVQYLGTHHGLAPEEAKPVMYFPERRTQDETNIPNEAVRGACASCHEFARPMSSRRSRREWALLQEMHVALYPEAGRQYERPATGALSPGGDVAPLAPGAKPPAVAKVALEWLSKNAPLHTPEWEAWRPRIQAPKLAGKWLVVASMPGRGRFIGQVNVAPKTSAADEFTTTATLHPLEGGASLTRTGTGLVYTGFSWRGTTEGSGGGARPDAITGPMRETLWFSPDQTSAVGRWYWGEYQEFGFDVKLVRDVGAPIVAALSANAIKTGAASQQVHLYGANLPTDLKPQDISFGNGVTVDRVVSVTPTDAVLAVSVTPTAVGGLRDLALRGAVLEKALSVYSRVDYVKVTPDTALAHLGGLKYAKGYAQFEAIGFSAGADGKPNTDDDFAVGPVDATWSMVEFPTTTYDDDVRYVGKLDNDGLFTPSVEGPSPQRRFMRNNYGEVWVVATTKSAMDKDGKPLSGRAYLVTTVPLYKRWDQPEVSK
jgi:quinohemoprotein amine dehydrogenase